MANQWNHAHSKTGNTEDPKKLKRRDARIMGVAAAKDSMLYVEGEVWSSVKIFRVSDTLTPTIEHLDWDRKSLAPYTSFKKLYGERKYAKQFPTKPMNVIFLDLPPETRNEIYRNVLLADPQYIDLCPKTNREASNGPARHHHTKRFSKHISPNLRILRTSKQVNSEASSIFYGEHEWRFTSVKGWYVLDSFLRQIGTANQARLRKLAIHVPWAGVLLEHEMRCKDALPESQRRIAVMQDTLVRMGLHPRMHWKSFQHATCVRRTQRILEGHGKLESLRLILPDSYRLWGTDEGKNYDPILEPTKFGTLRITLLRLHGGMVDEHRDLQALRDARRYSLASHVRVKNTAVEHGWEMEVEVYGELGYYPVDLVDGDVIEEIPDAEDGDA